MRDSAKALEHATKANEQKGEKDVVILEVVAAAHVAAGNFEEAVKWQTEAVEIGHAAAAISAKCRLKPPKTNQRFRLQRLRRADQKEPNQEEVNKNLSCSDE